jgi:periplasmic protein CpxP/Spy
MIHHFSPIARALIAAAMLSAMQLGDPTCAAAQTSQAPALSTPGATPPNASVPSAPSTQAAPTRKPGHGKMSPSDRVEARIRDLHARLQITPAQETQWNGVAQAMRDNAKTMETIISDRSRKMATMSAVDDLRSYESLAEAHADGMKRLVAAFDPFYDSLSDGQKKTADDLFRHHERHISARKKS